MKSYLNVIRVGVILMAWLIASNANADWLDTLTYQTAVSNSPNGPFSASARLWTQNVPSGFTPSSLDFYAVSRLDLILNDKVNVKLQLAVVNLTMGNYDGAFPSAPHTPFFIELTLPDQKSVLAGEFDFPSFTEGIGPSSFKFNRPNALTLGNKRHKLIIEPTPGELPEAPPDPNAISAVVAQYILWAVIPLDEIAPTPEPASLVLAGIGGVGFIGFAWRRRRKRIDF